MKSLVEDFIHDIKGHFKQITDSYVPMKAELSEEDEERQAYEKKKIEMRQELKATFATPFKLEYYFWLWFVYSLYATLKRIVFIPFEIITGIINSILAILGICQSKYITFFSIQVLVVGYIVQKDEWSPLFDVSIMYHMFRGQSFLKLYGLIFALQISQKILTMIGKYLYNRMKEQLQNQYINAVELIPEFLLCAAYTLAHSFSIFLSFCVYTVVINSSGSNFIIFCFVINLVKMKSIAFKKFDYNDYCSQLNFDAKDRIQKILYILLFQLSQFNRHIDNVGWKLVGIFVIGAMIEYFKHLTTLRLGNKLYFLDKVRNEMFYEMYIKTDDRTFIKCLNNDFTVIPFSVFVVKMLGVIFDSHILIDTEEVSLWYLGLCVCVITLKILIILIRKLNIFDCPTTKEQLDEMSQKLDECNKKLKSQQKEKK